MAITIYGVCAVTFMMTMYALERRGRRYILGFAVGCVLSSAYGFLSGAWPFGVVELVWSGIAVRRYFTEVDAPSGPSALGSSSSSAHTEDQNDPCERRIPP